jgi:WD40 repeat protein
MLAGYLTLRDVATGAQRLLLSNQPATYGLAFSPDGKVLATGSDDNLVRFWDVPTGTNMATLTGHSAWVRAAVFSRDGQWLATSQDKSRDQGPDKDFTVRLWNVSEKREEARTFPLTGGARTLCFSPDGQHLAVGGQKGEVSLWHVASRKRLAAHNGHVSRVSSATLIQSSLFLDGGHTLATADVSGWIVLWDVETHRILRSWQAHSSGIRSLALSADGRTLASGGYDEELVLWNVATWRAMLRLKHPAPIFSASFSSDGTMLATGGDDGMVRLWRAPSLNEIRSASATGQPPAR